MQLNAEDGGHRKFIMVQWPEECGEKSESYKAGYKNICEIGKERIRRAGEKIVEEQAHLYNAVKAGACKKERLMQSLRLLFRHKKPSRKYIAPWMWGSVCSN